MQGTQPRGPIPSRGCPYSPLVVSFARNVSRDGSCGLLSLPGQGRTARESCALPERAESPRDTGRQRWNRGGGPVFRRGCSNRRPERVRNPETSGAYGATNFTHSVGVAGMKRTRRFLALRAYSDLPATSADFPPGNLYAYGRCGRRHTLSRRGWDLLRGFQALEKDSAELSMPELPQAVGFPQSSFLLSPSPSCFHLRQGGVLTARTRFICSFLRSVRHAKKGIAQQKKRLPYVRAPDPVMLKTRHPPRHHGSSLQQIGPRLSSPSTSSQSRPSDPFIINDVHEEHFEKDLLRFTADSPPASSLPSASSSPSGAGQEDLVSVVRRVSCRNGVFADSREDHLASREFPGDACQGDTSQTYWGGVYPTAVTARTQLEQLATMRSVQYLGTSKLMG